MTPDIIQPRDAKANLERAREEVRAIEARQKDSRQMFQDSERKLRDLRVCASIMSLRHLLTFVQSQDSNGRRKVGQLDTKLRELQDEFADSQPTSVAGHEIHKRVCAECIYTPGQLLTQV